MFVDFFYFLKGKLPVSITEFLTLLEAFDKGLISDMVSYYYTCRSILVKSEHDFDIFDRCFASFYKDMDIEFPQSIKDEIWNWLNQPLDFDNLPFQLQLPPGMIPKDLEELRKYFEKIMMEQDEPHNFGNRFIGQKGTSPWGHSGKNPFGIRVGGTSGAKMAVQIAEKRIFRDYRKDIVLDTRQIKVALKRLKKLEEIGKQNELDLDKTIDETCKNCGDIELVFHKRRKNNIKVLLLLDVGGSMTPYATLVNKLFSAAHQLSHFRDFKYYYFHNCIYERLYETAAREDNRSILFEDFIRKYDSKYRVIIVGDAAMAPYELLDRYGSIYYYHRNEIPGAVYMQKLKEHFPFSVWLNPEIINPDWACYTRKILSKIFPMFNLTLEGLEKAMNYLRKESRHLPSLTKNITELLYH